MDFTKIAYVPGQKQTIGVHILPTADTQAISFQLTARMGVNDSQQAGTFSQSASAIRIDTANGIEYVSGAIGSRITVFEWTPPATGAGPVRFSVSAVAGTFGNSTADGNVYTASYTVQPATRELPDGYRWQSITLPFAGSVATGLADNGTIVGYTGTSGFVRTANGSVTTFQYPGAAQTLPRSVNSAGLVVGEYTENGGGSRAFVRAADGTLTPFQPALLGALYHVNDNGLVAGTLGSSAVTFPIANPASFSLLDAASATGIAANGNIVGRFNNSAYWRTTDGVMRGVSMCSGGTRGTWFQLKINGDHQIAGSCSVAYLGGGFTGHFVMAEGGRRWTPPDSLPVIDQTESGMLLVGSQLNGAVNLLTPCTGTASVTTLNVGAGGGPMNVPVQPSAGCSLLITRDATWFDAPSQATQAFQLNVPPNGGIAPRTAEIRVGGTTVTLTQAGSPCVYALNVNRTTIVSTGDAGGVGNVTSQAGCAWEASSDVPWIVLSGASGTGTGTFGFTILPNNGPQTRTGIIYAGDKAAVLLQAGGAACTYTVSPQSLSLAQSGATGPITVTTGAGCAWTATSSSANLNLSPQAGTGNGTVTFVAGPNLAASAVTSQLTIAGITVPVTQSGSANISLRYTPVTPCRAVDTRLGSGGRFSAGETRAYPLFSAPCGIPNNARAVAMNVTAVPPGPLSYVTAGPASAPLPLVSTLNSFNGRVVANFAIVPAAFSTVAVQFFASNATDLIVDVMGYFSPAADQGLQFYPLAPCRVADTRPNSSLAAGGSRSFAMRGVCGIPTNAQAYSMNVTAVPPQGLAFVTAWPTGQARPNASTLNAFDGSVVPNAAIIPAGTNGEISLYASDATDLVLDVNGYFAAPGTGGLNFYPLAPCRVADTRVSQTTIPLQSTARFAPPVCGTPANAQAYSLNFTAAPQGYLGFVTTYPGGTARPLASTLNSWNAQIVANAAIVPAGGDLTVEAFASNRTDLIVDINGYFAP